MNCLRALGNRPLPSATAARQGVGGYRRGWSRSRPGARACSPGRQQGPMTMLAATCRPQVPPQRLREVALAADHSGLAELWLREDSFWGGALNGAAAVLAPTSRLPAGT